jgi:amino acid transporter
VEVSQDRASSSPQLAKELGLGEVVRLSVSSITPATGVVVILPATIVALQSGAPVALLAAGILCLPIAYCYSSLTCAAHRADHVGHPLDGGPRPGRHHGLRRLAVRQQWHVAGDVRVDRLASAAGLDASTVLAHTAIAYFALAGFGTAIVLSEEDTDNLDHRARARPAVAKAPE